MSLTTPASKLFTGELPLLSSDSYGPVSSGEDVAIRLKTFLLPEEAPAPQPGQFYLVSPFGEGSGVTFPAVVVHFDAPSRHLKLAAYSSGLEQEDPPTDALFFSEPEGFEPDPWLAGPLGHGIVLPPEPMPIGLLACGPQGVVLDGFARSLSEDVDLTACWVRDAGSDEATPPPGHPFTPFHSTTLDEALEELEWAEWIAVAGPKAFLKEVQQRLSGTDQVLRAYFGSDFGGCGVGACLLCPVKTQNGYARQCADGPVFDLRELVFE
ncbi:MAG: hypothetical protein RLY93_10235 [Sumerlaeia bacterium]